MPQTTPQAPEQDLAAEIIKLNKTLRKLNSPWRAFLRGIITAIGTFIGVVLFTGLIGTVLIKAAKTVNWDDVVQSAVLRAVSGNNTRNR